MFFDGWNIIGRTLVIGPLAYLAMLLLLRVSGKRTLSKMNAFDFIVTVALGSTLASIIVSEGVALAEGVTAFALLIFAQYVITYFSVRSKRFESFVKAEPTLLYHQDRFLYSAMRHERVTEQELRAAARGKRLFELRTSCCHYPRNRGHLLHCRHRRYGPHHYGKHPHAERGIRFL